MHDAEFPSPPNCGQATQSPREIERERLNRADPRTHAALVGADPLAEWFNVSTDTAADWLGWAAEAAA